MKHLLSGLLCCLVLSCKPMQKPMEASVSTPSHKFIVYQVFTRLFGNQNLTNAFNGSRDENGVGKFNDITPKALQALKNFGVSYVWYTGVIEHATMTNYATQGIKPDNPSVVKGRAGSPYAIKDYYDVNPDLAVDVPNRMQEFEALVKRTHEAGLHVLIDFVPNHVARQYHSDAKPQNSKDFGVTDDHSKAFSAANNFYYLPGEQFEVPAGVTPPVAAPPYAEYPAKATGNDVFKARPDINDWYETIKLNYGVDYQNGRTKQFDPVPDTWLKMRDILWYWQSKGVDGFRCDMAEMVPVEFWSWVIPQVKARGKAMFIAEIYNPKEYHNYLFTGQFDYLYDKVGLYDALRRLMEGHGHTQDITAVWQKESGEFSERMLRFLENHDEQRIASDFFAKDATKGLMPMMLSGTLHSGPLMYYFGQEVGVKPDRAEGFQGNDGRTTIFDYWGVPEYQAWVNKGKFDGGGLSSAQTQLRASYERMNEFINASDAVKNGSFWDLHYLQPPNFHNGKLYAYLRFSDNQKLVFVYNFDHLHTHEIHLRLPKQLLDVWGYQSVKLIETQTGESQITQAAEVIESQGVKVNLSPYSYKIYTLQPN